MDHNTLNQLKTSLEQEKETLTKELHSIAEPDKHLKGDWDAKYVNLGSEWDDNAQEVTEYATRVPLEHDLEMRLLEVEMALARIDQGTYGVCEICGEMIPIERLTANPAARTCVQHTK
ncbi:MAG: TraR/DksA C4-type zinc finger protein [Patescibacteria group bacterium]